MAETTRYIPDFTAPERIELSEVVLQRWAMNNVSALLEAIEESYHELHQWMDWCTQPPTLDGLRELIERYQLCWPDPDGSFTYGIFDTADAVLGTVALHDSIGPRAVEIGYWCRTSNTGRGIITRAAGMLTELALRSPLIDRVEIRCDAANVRSAAVPRRLGYRLARRYERPRAAPADSGTALCWIKEAL